MAMVKEVSSSFPSTNGLDSAYLKGIGLPLTVIAVVVVIANLSLTL